MKKRRIASTRHMSKDDKRRLQLNKRLDQKTIEKKRAKFAQPTESKLFVKSNGSEAVRAPLNKRLIAIILAIVMVVGLIPAGVFMLRGKSAPEQTLKMDPVTMQVRINGKAAGETQINPGEISQNIDSVALNNPTNAEFVKAVIVDANGIETEIYSVGNKNHVDYYSVNKNGYTGVAKGDNDTLVLVYANRYKLNFANATENNGLYTVTGNVGTFRVTNVHHDDVEDYFFIYGGDNLGFREMTPAQDYTASSVSYQSASSSGTERVRNSSTTIVADSLSGNTNITVNFSPVSEYTIKDSRDISNSKYYPTLSGVENHGGTTNSLTTNTASLSSATEDTSWATSFYVFSQANSGSETWRLDMLSINGVDIPFPQAEGASAGPVTVDGMTITVTFVDEDGKFSGESNKPRTFYQIDMANVHENVEVAYYFVNTKDRTIMVKGLEGIAATGAAIEDEYLLNRYYTFDTNTYSIYTANYTAPGVFTGNNYYPSDNLILYQVKPGYNPYTVTTEMSYDFGVTKNSDGIREKSASGDTAAGTPLEVIKAAGNGAGLESTGRYNTSFRHWGYNDGELQNEESTYRKGFRTYDLLLTTIRKDELNNHNIWYAVALAQNANKTQQLYLNAHPYKYRLEVDVNGSNATFNDTNYAMEAVTTRYLENSANGHTVVDSNAYAYLPATAPIQAGKQFVGWQLVGSDGETVVSEAIYNPSDRIDFDDETIANAIGDVTGDNLTIRFKAKWVDLKNADVTTVKVNSYYQTAISDNDVEKYTQVLADEEESQVKGETAFLNDMTGKSLDDHYIINSDKSQLYSTTKATENDGSYGNDNEFVVYYDYRLHTFSVTKSVFGYPKSKLYEITVVFTRDTTSPVEMAQAQQLITAKLKDSENVISATSTDSDAGTITYVLTLSKDQTVDFTNVPYGWTYEVTEPENPGDYTNEISNGSGTITKDTTVDVANLVDTEQLQTNKYIEFNPTTGKYDLTLEAWATGDKVTKYDKDPVPTDIVLVIDQSGSMATGDMGDVYTPVNKNWKINDAAGDKIYYYKDPSDNQLYPVHAGVGEVYVPAESIRIFDLINSKQTEDSNGSQTSFGSVVTIGNNAYYNIATDRYIFPSDNANTVPKNCYVASIGVLGRYKAFPYYYNDINIEKTSGKNGDGSEWKDWVNWAGVFHADNLRGWHALFIQQSRAWTELVDNNRVQGFNDGNLESLRSSSWEGYTYSFFSDGEMVNGLYKKATGPNYLYYTNANGKEVNLTELNQKTVYRTDYDVAYSGTLYEISGKSRTAALQESVKQFSEMVAQNAADNDVQNRMAIVGFAGNEMPANSSGTTPNSSGLNDKWDYVNTGLFVNGDFINYNEIKSFTSLEPSENAYINQHYFIYDYPRGNNNVTTSNTKTYVPVVCDSTNRWYRLDSYYYLERITSGTNGDDNYYYYFYKPDYKPLTDNNGNQYSKALLDVKSNDGNDDNTYNDIIDQTISKFSAYGGTYTSYGMAMANQIFENNPDTDGIERNRIIVVFTDGQPGGSGFEKNIANEALAEAAIAKTEHKASIYTVGLYTEKQSAQVSNFMNQLSSNASQATTSNVYAGAQNKVGPLGSNSLDAEETYYYTEADDGKTYSVSAKESDGTTTLGWWATTTVTPSNGEPFNVYTKYVPRINSSDDRSDHTNFYKENTGNAQVYTEDGSLKTSETYWVGTSGNRVEVKYEYRWYNSNGRIKDPKTNNADNQRNHVQFFTVTSPSAEEKGYYQTAANEVSLKNAFEDIAENMSKTTISLTGANSALRDIVTDKFSNVLQENVKAYTVEGTFNTETGTIDWLQENGKDKRMPLTDATIEVRDVSESDQSPLVEVRGFDYSKHYLSETHNNGQKLVVTVSDLNPTKANFDLASNTGDSGIYQLVEGEDDPLLASFRIPEVNRPEYKLVIDGDDKNAQYTVKLQLKDAQNNVVTTDQWAKFLDINDTETLNPLDKDEDRNAYIAWTGSKADLTESIILEDVFKDLPKGYKVFASIEKANDNEDVFNYSVKLNKETDKEFATETEAKWFELPESGAEIDISSKRIPVDVVIKEITQGSDPANDYSDKGKSFNIKVTLYNGDTKINEDVTYGNTTYSKGELIMSLHHEQSRTIQVPNGYTIEVEELNPDEYVDTYTKVLGREDNEESTVNKVAKVDVDSTYTRVTVYNTLDTEPQTGILDSLKVNPFIIAVIILAIGGAGWLMIVEKRKRQIADQ